MFQPFEILCQDLLNISVSVSDNDDTKISTLKKLKEHHQIPYLNALKISQNDPRILSATGNPAILDALKVAAISKPVVSLKPFPIIVSEELFIENGYNIRPPHQEWPVMQGSHNGVVIWFPLHQLEPQHSSLEVFPKSHLRGVLDFEISRCGSKITCKDLGDPVPLSLNHTDLVILSTFTAHRSSFTAKGFRRALSIRFNDLNDASYISRGFPDNSKLTINREPQDDQKHGFLQNEGAVERIRHKI